jgi:hypothetical protein
MKETPEAPLLGGGGGSTKRPLSALRGARTPSRRPTSRSAVTFAGAFHVSAANSADVFGASAADAAAAADAATAAIAPRSRTRLGRGGEHAPRFDAALRLALTPTTAGREAAGGGGGAAGAGGGGGSAAGAACGGGGFSEAIAAELSLWRLDAAGAEGAEDADATDDGGGGRVGGGGRAALLKVPHWAVPRLSAEAAAAADAAFAAAAAAAAPPLGAASRADLRFRGVAAAGGGVGVIVGGGGDDGGRCTGLWAAQLRAGGVTRVLRERFPSELAAARARNAEAQRLFEAEAADNKYANCTLSIIIYIQCRDSATWSNTLSIKLRDALLRTRERTRAAMST